MNNTEIKDLLKKFREGTLNKEERALLENWVLFGEFNERELSDEELNRELDKVTSRLPLADRQRRLWPRFSVAMGIAAAVAAITLGVWLYYASNLNGRHPEGSAATRDLLANDIAPGKNTATIKIGDGEAITLSDKQTGVIVGEELRYSDNTFVIQSDPLSSRANAKDLLNSTNKRSLPYGRDDGRARMLTVTTPRGGTYQVTLPDGTKVWLNAASSLTYTVPLKERGGIRKVELSGEAYFEVFRNKNQPFVVTTKNLTTTVLGTHFNISAYDDEGSTKATLLEGSVKVSTLHSLAPPGRDAVGREGNVTLKPNQQAILNNNSQIKVENIVAEDAIAWKNGYFMFNYESLENVMEKLARWYDVKVIYDDPAMKNETVFGTISKFENISKVLRMFERADVVSFTVEGSTIKVKKKK